MSLDSFFPVSLNLCPPSCPSVSHSPLSNIIPFHSPLILFGCRVSLLISFKNSFGICSQRYIVINVYIVFFVTFFSNLFDEISILFSHSLSIFPSLPLPTLSRIFHEVFFSSLFCRFRVFVIKSSCKRICFHVHRPHLSFTVIFFCSFLHLRFHQIRSKWRKR